MVGLSSILTARKASLGEWRARTESHDLNGRLSLWRCGGWGGMSQLLERVSHAGRPHDPPVRPTSWTAGGELGSGSGSQAEPRRTGWAISTHLSVGRPERPGPGGNEL